MVCYEIGRSEYVVSVCDISLATDGFPMLMGPFFGGESLFCNSPTKYKNSLVFLAYFFEITCPCTVIFMGNSDRCVSKKYCILFISERKTVGE